MQQTLALNGKQYELIREQRNGLRLYKGDDSYVRVGPIDRIDRDITSHRAMAKAGYPVATILAEGEHDHEHYFIEQSLGEKTFRALFEESINEHETISDVLFDQLLRIVEAYLTAQAQARVAPDGDLFARGVHLDLIVQELPQYAHSLPVKFDNILKKVAGFPYVLSHGDFNASNVLPDGIIDLEDSFPAPFGFDAVSLISTLDWFPDSNEYEFYARYRYTAAQREKYLAMCDRVSTDAGYPKISTYVDDFSFCRAIWSVVNMQAYPRLQAWRYDKFIKTYLFY